MGLGAEDARRVGVPQPHHGTELPPPAAVW